VHFSMKVFLQDPDSLDERLVREAYTGPALVPASPWLDRRIPVRPIATLRSDSISGDRVLDLRPGIEGVATTATGPVSVVRVPWLWVVQTRADSGWSTTVLPGSESRHVLGARGAVPIADVWVTAVDRVGNASPAVRAAPPSP
jgi:hypothetical protein